MDRDVRTILGGLGRFGAVRKQHGNGAHGTSCMDGQIATPNSVPLNKEDSDTRGTATR